MRRTMRGKYQCYDKMHMSKFKIIIEFRKNFFSEMSNLKLMEMIPFGLGQIPCPHPWHTICIDILDMPEKLLKLTSHGLNYYFGPLEILNSS